MHRRRLLASTALSLGAVTGCLDQGTSTEEDDTEAPTEDAASDDDSMDRTDEDETDSPHSLDYYLSDCLEVYDYEAELPDLAEADPVEYAVTSFKIAREPDNGPDRKYPDDANEGPIDLFETVDEARAILQFEAVDDERRSDVESFVDETNFETSRLLYVAADTSYFYSGNLGIRSLGKDGETVVGSAVMSHPCIEDDERAMDSVLVRLPFETDPPEAARMTLVDGYGCVGTFEVAADDPATTAVEDFSCKDTARENGEGATPQTGTLARQS